MNWEIYTLTDPRTLRARYVGATTKGKVCRYRQHICEVKRGKRSHLYNWIRSLLRLGEKPIYLALEYGQGDGWQEREKFWIAVHRKFCDLVNATDGGEGMTGYVATPKTLAKMSVAHLGNKNSLGVHPSPETRAKLSAAGLGKKHSVGSRAKMRTAQFGKKASPETRAKLRAAHLGKKMSPETRAKMSAAHKNVSLETRAKLSAALIGNKRTLGFHHSPEARAKMSAAGKGRRHSEKTLAGMRGHVVLPETRVKIGLAQKGRRHSAETRRKMTESQLRRWRKRRK